MRLAAAALIVLAGVAAAPAAAGMASRLCGREPALPPAQKDRLFQVAAVVKAELERSGAALAMISRSGLDLGRFAQRYSHTGLSLKGSPETPWAVRQLYFDCDEQVPRLYDQGMSAFLLGMGEPAVGHVSMVFVPPAAAAALETAALDNRLALALLGERYSANAFAFDARYQNCNQWLAELLAVAWGPLPLPAPLQRGDVVLRAAAQRWLAAAGYRPTVFEPGVLMLLRPFVPWIHSDDHPPDDLEQGRYRVSMPASLEAFVQATVPGATRVEICHDSRRVVLRRGWSAIAEGCVPEDTDEVQVLD